MKLSTAILLIFLPAGCATLASSGEPVAALESSAMEASSPGGTAGPAEAGWSGPPAGTLGTPAFRARFLESYIGESEIEPAVAGPERDLLVRAMDLITEDKLEEAASLLSGRTGPGTSAVIEFTLGNVRFQQDRLAQAAQAYRAAVEKYPKFRRAWNNLGIVLVRMEDPAGAAAALSRVVGLGGGDGLVFGLLGWSHAQVGDHVAAESAYRFATLLDPGSTEWKMGLVRCFFKQERFAEAASLCGRLIAEAPERAELWLAQGEAFARLDQPLKAAGNFEIVDRLGASTAESLGNLGDIYANQALYDLSVNAFLRVLERFPASPPERAIRAARFLAAHGARAEARALAAGIETSLGERLRPEDRKELLRLRARLAVAEGAGDEEAALLEGIVLLDPLDGDALILLGQHHGRRGDFEKAVFYLERAANIEAHEADARIRHAQLLVARRDYRQAIPLLQRAQEIRPRDNVQNYLEQVERAAAQAR